MTTTCDIAVCGGGIVGLATAMALAERFSVTVLEAEDAVGRHQSGHNSGVIHSGLYYRPGSLKARLSTSGRRALERFCGREGIAWKSCGKLVVASDRSQLSALDELERRGHANGLDGLERLDGAGIRAREPRIAGVAGLWVPQTGIVDFAAVCQAMARRVGGAGGEIRTGARVLAVRREQGGLLIETTAGTWRASYLVACAGLECDRVARLCGVEPELRIIPFRGEYWEVRGERRRLARVPIYPVPDPRFPFLGVHLTPTIDGRLEAGPNAVVAWKRAGYRRSSFSPRDAWETLSYPGFWRLARRFWRTGAREMWRSASRRSFVAALRRLAPEIGPGDLARGGCGVRAQAVDRDGRLVDDFHLLAAERSLHVLNAPSPAATASISIGRHLAEQVTAAKEGLG